MRANIRAGQLENLPLLDAMPLLADLVSKLLAEQPKRLAVESIPSHPMCWSLAHAVAALASALPAVAPPPGLARQFHAEALRHLPAMAAWGPGWRPAPRLCKELPASAPAHHRLADGDIEALLERWGLPPALHLGWRCEVPPEACSL